MKIIGCLAVCRDLLTIGDRGGLPWGEPLVADMKRFRHLTMGSPVIYGRRTLESMHEPLRGRYNIVLTRFGTVPWKNDSEGYVAASIAEAIQAAGNYWDQVDQQDLPSPFTPKVFILGGSEVFHRTWNLLDECYLTVVDHPGHGSTQLRGFPFFPDTDFMVMSQVIQPKDEHNRYAQHFIHYVRRA